VVGGRIHGPGVRDDAAGLAALIALAQAFEDCDIRGPADLVLAATVGEEGLGNLRGMRALLDVWRNRLDAVLCVDGDLAGVVHVGIGSVRLRVTISGPGGHSWGNFGRPSAIHLLAGCIVDLAALPLPAEPRTTYNVGTVSGGLSVNTIAPSAEMVIDLRSVDPGALAVLERGVRSAVAHRLAPAPGCRAEVTVLGTRPAASLPERHPLVSLARAVHRELAIVTHLEAGSTDANLPLAEGLPAVCVGVSTGGGVHTTAEFLDADSLLVGLKALTLLVASAWEGLRMPEDAAPHEPRGAAT
jgi:tripeptide aminopeptidase